VDKPFAVMVSDLGCAELHASLDEFGQMLLQSSERPIVLSEWLPTSTIVSQVAPRQNNIGLMLPYTPLHYLLIEPETDFPRALVMTSGNLSEEPIASSNSQARQRLGQLADAFLMHDRGIHIRCDDSVVRSFQDRIYPVRRSRGYVPFPVMIPWEGQTVFAAGAELKNTFCFTRDRYAFLSHHIGDMENYETAVAYEEGIHHLEKLFHLTPELIAYDLHPDYLATREALRWAENEGIPAYGIQHHHAHIAACMADNGLDTGAQVIGVSFDGTGYGLDGAIWGGEILIASYSDFERPYHLRYCPLPGGDAAVRQPWRVALAWLSELGLESEFHSQKFDKISEKELQMVTWQLRQGINAPATSSMGRLFDAVASLAGVRQRINYEAQAAIEFESLADPAEEGVYTFTLTDGIFDPEPMFRSLLDDIRSGVSAAKQSARFHRGLADLVRRACEVLRDEKQINSVALSGGVWQNMFLLELTVRRLETAGFQVLLHEQVPANDGGLCLGQASIAFHRAKNGAYG
jgi:hydrogenase maturation protein HypF